MKTPSTFLSILLVIFAVESPAKEAASETELPDEINFNDHIRPIFNQHCVACHGGVKQAADISFVYKDQVLPPDGWIVEPGDPDASILIERVMQRDPDLQMPPPEHGEPLSTTEVALLKKWIRQGAPWKASHWAYAKPELPAIPDVSDPDWPAVPMDHFVLARLDAEKLDPSPQAPPERWLRRVTLDLTGLPPTLEQRREFLRAVQNDVQAARRKVVQRLLNSPEYGERWASVWLDQVRYADSKGLGADSRRSVWKYRDWVIRSLNSDLPYDEFSVKQIAGDLLPDPSIEDYVATAAHRLTQTNEEGGTDDEEFRIAAVLDRVNTTWQVWQGVTFGCVQCHSHPYDPFRHEEYYEFAAFFNDTRDSDLNEDWPVVRAPLDPADNQAASKLDQKIRELNHELWETEFDALRRAKLWEPLNGLTATTNNATKVAVETNDDHDEFHTVGTVSRNTDFTLEAPVPADIKRLTAVRVTAMPLDPEQAISDSEWGFVMSQIQAKLIVGQDQDPIDLKFANVICDEPEPFYDPNESLNPKSNRGFAAYTQIHYPRQAALILEAPVDVPDGATLQVQLKHRVYLLAAFSMVTRRGHLAVSDSTVFQDLFADDDLVSKRNRLANWKAERSKIKSVSIPVLEQRPDHLSRPSYVFERGLFLTKGQQVTPGTPESLPPLRDGQPEGRSDDEPVDRLDLARWIVSPENPLTARVAVNRVWARLFGVGLVASEEDFGSSGERPSHPQLLDYLAVRFQTEQRWSMKKLIGELVLSKTYGQSSVAQESLHQRDPQNRLLARGPRFRLPSEVVRDQALAVAGLLSDKRFGPPVHPPIPGGVWNPFSGGDKWTVPQRGDEDRYRRSIYTYMKRSIPYPMFAAFDSPSREFCTPRRLRSNTPLQALMMLNDETFIECTQGLASRMAEASESPESQIRHGFLIVTCREPSDTELRELMSLYKKTAANADDDAAKLRDVATVLLNLDEVVMK